VKGHDDAACPTGGDEPKDLNPKWLSLDMPLMQPYCVDACGALLKSDTKRSSKEEIEFELLSLRQKSATTFTVQFDLDDSGNLGFNTHF